MKSVEVQNKTERPIPPRLLAVSSVSGSRNSPQAVLRQRIFLRVRFPATDILRDSPCRSRPSGRLGIYICVGFLWGENETLDRTYSNFAIRDTRSIRRTGGGSPPRNIRELLSLVYKINDAIPIGLGGRIYCRATTRRVHDTSAGLAWGDVPPQMPSQDMRSTATGHALQPAAVSGVAGLYLPFRHVGFQLSFKADLHQNASIRLRLQRDFPGRDAEPFSTELRRRARYKLLGHLFAVPARPEQEFFGRAQLQRGVSYDLRYADNNAPVHRFEEEEWIPDPNEYLVYRPHSQSTSAYAMGRHPHGRISPYQADCDYNGTRTLTRNTENTGYPAS